MEAPYYYFVRFAIAPQAEDQLLNWLDAGGHSAEVADQPGFLWAKRIKVEEKTEEGWPQYINIYGLESEAALKTYQADTKLGQKFADQRKGFAQHLKADRAWGSLDASAWHNVPAPKAKPVLVGRFVSPFTRRVAVTMKLYGIDFEHKPYGTGDQMAEIKSVNPLGRVPALVLGDGTTLVESGAIIDWLDEVHGGDRPLTPAAGPQRRLVNQLVAQGTAAMDKMVALVYERGRRPADKVHQPWVDHLLSQFHAGLAHLEAAIGDDPYIACERLTQADLATAIAYEFGAFMHKDEVTAKRYPKLAAFAQRLHALPAFAATKLG